MTAETATLSVRKVVRVELPLERAFELFTAGVGSWWPTLTHSIHEADVAELVWEAGVGGRLYEGRRRTGPTCSCGSRRTASCSHGA